MIGGSPQSQNLRGSTAPGSPSSVEVVSPGDLHLTHTSLYLFSPVADPNPIPVRGRGAHVGIYEFGCPLYFVSYISSDKLFSLPLGLCFPESFKARRVRGVVCTCSRGAGRGVDSRLGSGLASLMKGKMLEFSLRGGFFKFEHSIFCLPGRGKPGRVAGGPS